MKSRNFVTAYSAVTVACVCLFILLLRAQALYTRGTAPPVKELMAALVAGFNRAVQNCPHSAAPELIYARVDMRAGDARPFRVTSAAVDGPLAACANRNMRVLPFPGTSANYVVVGVMRAEAVPVPKPPPGWVVPARKR